MKTSKPEKKKDVHARELGSEWLLYDPEFEKLHILNTTAEFVWRLCDGTRDVAAIKAEMIDTFDVADQTRLDEDVKAILTELSRIGILQGFES